MQEVASPSRPVASMAVHATGRSRGKAALQQTLALTYLLQALLLVLSLELSLTGTDARAEVTQTFALQPGWNAVFLEVQPAPSDPAAVFSGVPVHSVWTWFPRSSTVQFIQNPDEVPWGAPGWGVYLADPSRAHLTNLFAIQANQAYLVRLAGSGEATWSVSGQPAPATYRWSADSFNLVGFPVDPAQPPTFAAFLAASPAHADLAIHYLDEDDAWQPVADPTSATIVAGQAYWVYCAGTSTYSGPVQVVLPSSRGLDYGIALDELSITLANLSASAHTVTLALESSEVALAYRHFDAATGYFTWPSLASLPPLTLDPGRQQNLHLAVRREEMGTGLWQATLTILDDAGGRNRVQVSVEKVGD